MTDSTGSTSRVTRGTAGQGTTRGAGQVTGVLVSVQAEGSSRSAVGSRHITVTVPCSTTSVGTVGSGHPDIKGTGGVTTLCRVAATSVGSGQTLVTSTILTTHSGGTGLCVVPGATGGVTSLNVATRAAFGTSSTQLTRATSGLGQVTSCVTRG